MVLGEFLWFRGSQERFRDFILGVCMVVSGMLQELLKKVPKDFRGISNGLLAFQGYFGGVSGVMGCVMVHR